MSSNLRREIYSRMNLKDTDELLVIWQENDRAEWSNDAFDVVQEILQERGVDIPEQGQPIQKRSEEEVEMDAESYGFSEEELKIIDDENPPELYDPFDVLLLTRRIDQMAKVMIGFVAVYSLVEFPRSLGIVQSYFIQAPNSILMYLITVLLVTANAGLSMIIAYFPLKALSRILLILMEMELRSRKVI